MPFARLIPTLNISNSIFEQNSVKNKMLNDPSMAMFCANVYEAFSSVAKKISTLPKVIENEDNSVICKNSMLNQVS